MRSTAESAPTTKRLASVTPLARCQGEGTYEGVSRLGEKYLGSISDNGRSVWAAGVEPGAPKLSDGGDSASQ